MREGPLGPWLAADFQECFLFASSPRCVFGEPRPYTVHHPPKGRKGSFWGSSVFCPLCPPRYLDLYKTRYERKEGGPLSAIISSLDLRPQSEACGPRAQTPFPSSQGCPPLSCGQRLEGSELCEGRQSSRSLIAYPGLFSPLEVTASYERPNQYKGLLNSTRMAWIRPLLGRDSIFNIQMIHTKSTALSLGVIHCIDARHESPTPLRNVHTHATHMSRTKSKDG